MVSRQRLSPHQKGEAQCQGIDRLIDMYDVVFIVSLGEGELGQGGLTEGD
jgi:hypothetical protein